MLVDNVTNDVSMGLRLFRHSKCLAINPPIDNPMFQWGYVFSDIVRIAETLDGYRIFIKFQWGYVFSDIVRNRERKSKNILHKRRFNGATSFQT